MEQKPGIKLWQALLLLSCLWIAIILLGSITVQIGKQLHRALENELTVSGVVYVISFMLTIAAGVFVFKLPFHPSLSRELIRPAIYPVLVISLIGMAIVASELDNLIRLSLPLASITGKTPTPALWQIITISVFILPIFMEVFFRGYLLKGLLVEYPEEIAIIASGVIFGLFFPVPNAFVLGLLSGWVFARTKSLIPSIFMAVLNSSLPVAFEFTKLTIPGFNTDPSTPQLQPLWFDGIGVALLFLGICLLIQLYGRPRQQNESPGGV